MYSLGFISGVLTVIGFVPYIFSIHKGGVKPRQVTWWIWTVNSFLLLASYKAEGADETLWLSMAYTIGCLSIAVLTLRRGIGGWSSLDIFCFFGAFIALIFWALLGSLATFITTLVIDFLGIIPTIYSSFYRPHEESRFSWSIWCTAGILSILSIDNLFLFQQVSFETLTILAYPAQITLTSGLIVCLLFRRDLKKLIYLF